MGMITKHRTVLLAALFVLSGLFVAQAQENLLNLKLVRDHCECDYDLNSETNYYRDVVTFDSPDLTNMFTVDDVIAGENSFVLHPLLCQRRVRGPRHGRNPAGGGKGPRL